MADGGHGGSHPFLVDSFVSAVLGRSPLSIDARTAADIFRLDPDRVDRESRRRAKMINFGIIYGMSAYGLATRLAILPPRMAVGDSHQYLESLLPDHWTAQQVYDHHEVLMLHGQRCCFHHNPACTRCPLLDLCPTGQSSITPGRPPATPTRKPPGADA